MPNINVNSQMSVDIVKFRKYSIYRVTSIVIHFYSLYLNLTRKKCMECIFVYKVVKITCELKLILRQFALEQNYLKLWKIAVSKCRHVQLNGIWPRPMKLYWNLISMCDCAGKWKKNHELVKKSKIWHYFCSIQCWILFSGFNREVSDFRHFVYILSLIVNQYFFYLRYKKMSREICNEMCLYLTGNV